nr:hypothetical protein CFP56_08020 [Quercus suber]
MLHSPGEFLVEDYDFTTELARCWNRNFATKSLHMLLELRFMMSSGIYRLQGFSTLNSPKAFLLNCCRPEYRGSNSTIVSRVTAHGSERHQSERIPGMTGSTLGTNREVSLPATVNVVMWWRVGYLIPPPCHTTWILAWLADRASAPHDSCATRMVVSWRFVSRVAPDCYPNPVIELATPCFCDGMCFPGQVQYVPIYGTSIVYLSHERHTSVVQVVAPTLLQVSQSSEPDRCILVIALQLSLLNGADIRTSATLIVHFEKPSRNQFSPCATTDAIHRLFLKSWSIVQQMDNMLVCD